MCACTRDEGFYSSALIQEEFSACMANLRKLQNVLYILEIFRLCMALAGTTTGYHYTAKILEHLNPV
jgi:hypothetical protein